MSDNNAFTAETAAQHQAELNDYLQSKNINQLFIQIVESLLIEKPDNPIGFIVQFLGKKYPDQAMVSGPPAVEVGNIIANSSKPQQSAQQTAAADPDEEEDEDDEDDEDDYIDDLPIASKYQEKGVKAKRMSIMSESPTNMSASDIVKIEKSPAEKQSILNTLASCVLFKHLEGTQLDTLADAMEMKTFQEGELIIQQGDDGDFFYVVDKGVIDCYKDEKKIYTYQNEGQFGELAIMYNAPRAATCKARTQASLWALERKAFKTILMTSTMEKRNKYKEFLSAVEMLSELNEYEVLTIADSLNEETHTDQSVLCRQGEAGDTFYIVKEVRPNRTKCEWKQPANDPSTCICRVLLCATRQMRRVMKSKWHDCQLVATSER